MLDLTPKQYSLFKDLLKKDPKKAENYLKSFPYTIVCGERFNNALKMLGES
jgi:hypothetical protein